MKTLSPEARTDKPPSSSNSHGANDVTRIVPATTVRWNVTSVRPVPTFYPLERNCITVTGIPLSVLCSRILNFMRVNSISCTFHKTRVDCATMGLLKFAVHLWKASRSPSDDGVLVEIQRRQGCSIQMQHIRQGLVQVITTGEAPVVVSERTNMHTVDCIGMPKHESKCIEALNITKRLLESSQFDQSRLGMESMVALTSPQTVHAKDAKLVCRALVYGDAPFGDSLRDALVPFFQDTERDQEHFAMDDYDSDAEDEEEEYAQGYHFGSMHNLALRVLANALQVVTELHDNGRDPHLALVDLASPFWNSVCNALVYNVEVANHRPREAALSAKCLNLLTILAPVICECPIIDRLVPVLPEANEYGKECNLLLERESHKLMGTLAGAS